MTYPGFDPVAEARFRATIENEQKHIWAQIELLWKHNGKRRAEIETARKDLGEDIAAARKQATKEIDAIKNRINGAILSFAIAAAGAVVILLKPKLGL